MFSPHSSLTFIESSSFHSFLSFGLWTLASVPRLLLENIHGFLICPPFLVVSAIIVAPLGFCLIFPIPHAAWGHCTHIAPVPIGPTAWILPTVVSTLMLRVMDEYMTTVLEGNVLSSSQRFTASDQVS